MFVLPYSPRWLVDKNRNEEALQTLARLHAEGDQEDPYVVQEYNEIVEFVKFERENAVRTYRDLFSKQNRRRVMLAVGIQSMQVSLIQTHLFCKKWNSHQIFFLAMDWNQRW
jgi:ABC-type multidrug transport system ATPase subunit